MNLNPIDKTGRSPLFYALIHKNLEASKELALVGAKIIGSNEDIMNHLTK